MYRTVRPFLLLAVASTVLLGAGCSSTVAGTAAPAGAAAASTSAPVPPTSAAAATDAVAWVDEVCGALLTLGGLQTTQPEIDTTDLAATIEGISSYLGDASDSIDTAVAGMAAAGPSPVEGGDEFVTKLSEALTSAGSTFAEAKTKIDAVDPTDLAEVSTALPEAVAPLEALENLPNPTADLQSSPELDAAAQQAPNCKTLSAG